MQSYVSLFSWFQNFALANQLRVSDHSLSVIVDSHISQQLFTALQVLHPPARTATSTQMYLQYPALRGAMTIPQLGRPEFRQRRRITDMQGPQNPILDG